MGLFEEQQMIGLVFLFYFLFVSRKSFAVSMLNSSKKEEKNNLKKKEPPPAPSYCYISPSTHCVSPSSWMMTKKKERKKRTTTKRRKRCLKTSKNQN